MGYKYMGVGVFSIYQPSSFNKEYFLHLKEKKHGITQDGEASWFSIRQRPQERACQSSRCQTGPSQGRTEASGDKEEGQFFFFLSLFSNFETKENITKKG